MTIRYGKRGRTRAIPRRGRARRDHRLDQRPPGGRDRAPAASLPRTGQPPRPLGTRDIARIVARHSQTAGLPEDRRAPHVLRHTFCTHLADTGADTAVIRELAGDADIGTRHRLDQRPPCTPQGSDRRAQSPTPERAPSSRPRLTELGGGSANEYGTGYHRKHPTPRSDRVSVRTPPWTPRR